MKQAKLFSWAALLLPLVASAPVAQAAISCQVTPAVSIIAEGQTVALTATCTPTQGEVLKWVAWYVATKPTSGPLGTYADITGPTELLYPSNVVHFTTPVTLGQGASEIFVRLHGDPDIAGSAIANITSTAAQIVVKQSSGIDSGAPISMNTNVPGECGSAHGTNRIIADGMPSGTQACAAGKGKQILAITTPTAYSWTCQSPTGGQDASCYAILATPVPGACGSANGGSFSSQPSSGLLCGAGNGVASWTDQTATDGTWNWTCGGASGGSASPGCSANKVTTPVTGTCGSSNGGTFSSQPTTSLCGSGNGVPTWTDSVASDGTWNWTCGGDNGGGASPGCSATNSVAPVTGACGSANGGSFSSQPTTSLCGAGNGVATWTDQDAADGNWNWTCGGANGGAASGGCAASKIVVGGSNDPGQWTGTWQAASNVFVVDPQGAQGAGTITFLPGCVNQRSSDNYQLGCAAESTTNLGGSGFTFGGGNVLSIRFRTKSTIPAGGSGASFNMTGTDGGPIYVPAKMWLSATPNGPELSSWCKSEILTMGSASTLQFLTHTKRCPVTAGTLYYLNVTMDRGGLLKLNENGDFQ